MDTSWVQPIYFHEQTLTWLESIPNWPDTAFDDFDLIRRHNLKYEQIMGVKRPTTQPTTQPMTHFGELVRGEFSLTSLLANTAVPITLFNNNGNVRPLSATERLLITDIEIVYGGTGALSVFFDIYGDGKVGQIVAPTLVASGTGSSIAAGTYTLGFTFFDANTGRESALSATGTVTPTIGQNITVTAPVALPAWNANGYIKVYRSDGGGTGLVGQSLPGSNSVVLTSVAVLGNLPTSGANGQGKLIAVNNNASGSGFTVTALQPDGIVGPAGVPASLSATIALTPTNASVCVNGRIFRDGLEI